MSRLVFRNHTLYFIGFWIHLSLIPIVYSRLSIPTTWVEVRTNASVNGSPISLSILASESLSLCMIAPSYQHCFTLLSLPLHQSQASTMALHLPAHLSSLNPTSPIHPIQAPQHIPHYVHPSATAECILYISA